MTMPTYVVTKRVVAVGQVIAGVHNLYWISCNPSAGNSAWEVTDATAALGAVELDEFHTNKEGHVNNYIPPKKFNKGIYLETFTNMTSMTFGYV